MMIRRFLSVATASVAFGLCCGLIAQQQPAAAAAPATQTTGPKVPMAQSLSDRGREGLDKHLDDWAQLKRYADDNAKLGTPAAGERRVVFYGDSITDGWGRRYGKFFPGKPYVNRGISGQTTPQMVVRFRQDVIDLHPAAVVILAGTNDVAGNTGPETIEQVEGYITSMAELARANKIRVVLASVLPAGAYPWRPEVAPVESIHTINAWMKSYCDREHLVYLNYFDAMSNPDGAMKPELAADKFVHPNDAGYAVMQPLAQAAVDKALK